MKVARFVFTIITIFLIIASIALTSCGRHNMNFNFAEIMEGESLYDISLTIYYASTNIFTPIEWRVEDLIRIRGDNKIIISGSELEASLYLFKQINSDILILARGRSPHPPLVRFYYVLESEKNGKLFDVVLWGGRNGAIFNGVEVEMHYIFYDIMIPFLPEDFAERMMRWRDELAYGSK